MKSAPAALGAVVEVVAVPDIGGGGGRLALAALGGATFASGVGVSSVTLVSTIPGLGISNVSSVASGGASATLTLSHSGTHSADATLAVRVLASAHAGAGDLAIGSIDMLAAADTRTRLGRPRRSL